MSVQHQAVMAGLGGGVTPLGLTYRGHGRVPLSSGGVVSGIKTLNYGTVAGGLAPSPGDLVVWSGLRVVNTGSGNAFQDLTSLGWAQSRLTFSSNAGIGTILAKVVDAGNISAPPSILNENVGGDGMMMWQTFSITGAISALSVAAATLNPGSSGGSGAPASIGANSSGIAPADYAITIGEKSGGTVGGSTTPTMGGVAWDRTQTFDGSFADFLSGMKLDLGGANYTITGGDDGGLNALLAGYVRVQG